MKEIPEHISPFEEQLQGFEASLEEQFKPKIGSNLRTNVGWLRRLHAMNKSELEAFMSRATLISLNDEEFQRLHHKIGALLKQNLTACIEMGLSVDSV